MSNKKKEKARDYRRLFSDESCFMKDHTEKGHNLFQLHINIIQPSMDVQI